MKESNLSTFAWKLLKYLHHNHTVLSVTEEVYKERIMTCRNCDKYNELQNVCMECGCFIPMKTKIVFDSCPLNKWTENDMNWEETFNSISEKLDSKN